MGKQRRTALETSCYSATRKYPQRVAPFSVGRWLLPKGGACRPNLRFSGPRKDEQEIFMLNGITDGSMLLALILRVLCFYKKCKLRANRRPWLQGLLKGNSGQNELSFASLLPSNKFVNVWGNLKQTKLPPPKKHPKWKWIYALQNSNELKKDK